MAEPAALAPEEAQQTSEEPGARTEMVRVRVDPQGPTYVEGPVEICVDGEEPLVVDRFRVAICSCRCSARYPLCDGTHNKTRARRPRVNRDGH